MLHGRWRSTRFKRHQCTYRHFCCSAHWESLNDFDVNYREYRKSLLLASTVLYFGRVVLRFRKITGALQAPAGKVLTYLNLLNVSAAPSRLGFNDESLEGVLGKREAKKYNEPSGTEFEGGGEIITVSIPRMYEETCVSIKADAAFGL